MASQKYVWICELSKDKPSQTWKPTNEMELEDEGDSDFEIHSLILKSAMLGSKSVDGERSIVAIKTKGIDENEIEQPVFSLTQGRNDMIANFDLHLGTRNPIEFKLVEGSGPVYITCSHVLEMPPPDEQQTLMTTTDGECEELDEDEDEEVEETAETTAETNGKRPSAAALKLKNGKKNGANGTAENDANGIEVDEKPNKRKRN